MDNHFTKYRKHIYASINGTKGNLIKLSKSGLLSHKEKEKLELVIDAMECLRIEYYNKKKKKNEK